MRHGMKLCGKFRNAPEKKGRVRHEAVREKQHAQRVGLGRKPRQGDKGMQRRGLYPQTVFHCMEIFSVFFYAFRRMFSFHDLKNADGM